MFDPGEKCRLGQLLWPLGDGSRQAPLLCGSGGSRHLSCAVSPSHGFPTSLPSPCRSAESPAVTSDLVKGFQSCLAERRLLIWTWFPRSMSSPRARPHSDRLTGLPSPLLFPQRHGPPAPASSRLQTAQVRQRPRPLQPEPSAPDLCPHQPPGQPVSSKPHTHASQPHVAGRCRGAHVLDPGNCLRVRKLWAATQVSRPETGVALEWPLSLRPDTCFSPSTPHPPSHDPTRAQAGGTLPSVSDGLWVSGTLGAGGNWESLTPEPGPVGVDSQCPQGRSLWTRRTTRQLHCKTWVFMSASPTRSCEVVSVQDPATDNLVRGGAGTEDLSGAGGHMGWRTMEGEGKPAAP